MHYQTIFALVNSQAAIKALIKCTVALITVFNCIRNLNQQRWSSRGCPWPLGHILKSFALAQSLQSLALASKP